MNSSQDVEALTYALNCYPLSTKLELADTNLKGVSLYILTGKQFKHFFDHSILQRFITFQAQL